MLVMASRPNDDITSVPPPLTPGRRAVATTCERVLDNEDVMFGQAVINSLLVAVVATVCVVLFSRMAGFAFAKLRFIGRQPLLAFVLATMMVPIQLGLIPLYMLMTKIAPRRHAARGHPAVPRHRLRRLHDAPVRRSRPSPTSCSRRPGSTAPRSSRIFWFVVLPLLRPAAAVLALLTFMERWNDFLWPYLVLDLEHPTVQVALSRLSGGYYTDQALVMAGTLLGVVPLLVVFILFGRQIVGGIMEGGVKS